ncbi:MAG: hypothetical protein Q9168_006063 [Polycauliona sp. 1 TL-2023]
MDPAIKAHQDALAYEKTNMANGSVFTQDFYTLSPTNDNTNQDPPPGTPLKIEQETDVSKYLLPPMTSMSRYIYQSATLSNLPVPASAAILWPYSPKTHGEDGKYPVVVWAHGTSGIFAENPPSNHRTLWQHFLAPFQLVSAGYVVICPDYAGLGVSRTAGGKKIMHQYLASPAHANDIVYAVQAARRIWKDELSRDWIVIGHSQGGAAAWGVAQRQAKESVDGYLGAVAVSPVTNLEKLEGPFVNVVGIAMMLGRAEWDTEGGKLENLVTEEGEKRLEMIEESGAGTSASIPLMLADGVLKPGWQTNEAFQRYLKEVENGGREIAGPLLVLHGETDQQLSIKATAKAVEDTAKGWPESKVDFVRIPKAGHVPAIQAGQRIWMEWIADRFAGRDVKPGVTTTTLTAARPPRSYLQEHNWYLEAATEPYHAP